MQLLQFPFLVLQCFAERLELYEVFTLATVSNKLKIEMKSWLCRRRFTVVYNTEGYFEIGRKISDKLPVDKLQVILNDRSYQELAYNYELWTLLNRESVPVKVTEDPDHSIAIDTYWPDIAENIEIKNKMLEFIVELFPKPIFTLSFYPDDKENAQNALELVKKLEVDVDTVTTGAIEEAVQDEAYDEFAKLILDECHIADRVIIECRVSDGFEYDFKKPFNLKLFKFNFGHWVTKNDVINYFLGCDEIILENKHFSDQELSEIVMEWAKDSKGNGVEFLGPDNVDAYRTSLLIDVVEHFPDAVAVQKASVRLEGGYRTVKFKEGRAYAIKTNDGSDALVYKLDNIFSLTKDFQLSKEIDEMDTEVEDDEEEEEDDGEEIEENDEVEDEHNNDD